VNREFRRIRKLGTLHSIILGIFNRHFGTKIKRRPGQDLLETDRPQAGRQCTRLVLPVRSQRIIVRESGLLARERPAASPCRIKYASGGSLKSALAGFAHDLRFRFRGAPSTRLLGRNPFPIPYLRHVLAVFRDVVLMFDELIPKSLFQVSAPST
jgi:hypothetical protein